MKRIFNHWQAGKFLNPTLTRLIMGRSRKPVHEDDIVTSRITVKHTSRGYVVNSRPIFTTPLRKNARRFSSRGSNSESPRKKARFHRLSPTGDFSMEVGSHAQTPPRISPPTFVLSRKKTTYSQHDFMADWIPHKGQFLSAILEGERKACIACAGCGGPEPLWRCLECVGRRELCRVCMREKHRDLPFHRVERWDETHWNPAWLWQIGVVIPLGHGGAPCPTPQGFFQEGDEGDDEEYWTDEEIDPEDNTGEGEPWLDEDKFSFAAKPNGRRIGDDRVVIVMHTNGVHHVLFHVCGCPDHPSETRQFLDMRLYPASVKTVRSVATFDLLDDYHMNQVECHTSTYHYFAKLRRVTNKAFPHTVPNRYRELARMGRQWIHLKNLKWFGFGHTDAVPADGDLALFCSACPQKGVNVPEEEWDSLPDILKLRSFVADGNFSCVHQKQRAAHKDVWITSGTGFMAERTAYSAHIKSATEDKQTSTCHEHRAIADKWKSLKGCDVTGIGAIACMRHGCFVPGAMVDFQKGERQINMDYAWLKALKMSGLDGVRWVLLVYDINCQYCINFMTRIKKYRNPDLKLPRGLVIVNAIGLWHVHGHRPECYARFAPSFVSGAGTKSGEILEPLWVPMNKLAGPTRTMSSSHRAETLDAGASDSNWKKLTGIGLPKAKEQAEEALERYTAISAAVTKTQIAQWGAELDEAKAKRLKDFKAMDILNSKLDKVPKRAAVEAELMDKERASGEGLGVTSWISAGIDIQEKQIEVKRLVRKYKNHTTPKQKLEIAKSRQELTSSIETFHKDAEGLFPGFDISSCSLSADTASLAINLPAGDGAIEVGSDDDMDGGSNEEDGGSEYEEDCNPEDIAIPLPSAVTNWPPSHASVRRKEQSMRVAQANSKLEAIRDAIGRLSYLYRSLIRGAKTKKSKTRSYGIIKGSRDELRLLVNHYEQARYALRQLDASPETLSKYRPIRPADLKISTAIADPNARGQSSTHLSWIWGVPSTNPADRTVYLDELYRVNWMRTREKYLRQEEEFQFLLREAGWVPRFFDFKAKVWDGLRTQVSGSGHLAYASRQAQLWRNLARYARERFSKTLKDMEEAVGRAVAMTSGADAESSGTDSSRASREISRVNSPDQSTTTDSDRCSSTSI
ncbi:hypothetical protein CC1G_10453 [Coprinopsis cinerea okayama7|uniref:CxC2-like cysteine cluster KDZ transposase-associated domain-containing protein n=1 Tax=Coprinopsis cinerea (strain Okayama-7 / 130 / ATCC MYA-4618 / FGSC 9003) TaxID=240176 RepID=A8PDU1_COPC7|nr:hypothetical protein CC1G_10453 [Coprinopsis cinerea okayama7\|eukprot:XP_001840667.2 hypothetical protein CC1G_10453 [Coprinopsis cinerea okayama7\